MVLLLERRWESKLAHAPQEKHNHAELVTQEDIIIVFY